MADSGCRIRSLLDHSIDPTQLAQRLYSGWYSGAGKDSIPIMKTSFLCLALLAAQLPTLQAKPVVRLRVNQEEIRPDYGGAEVVRTDGPRILHLPSSPPLLDAHRRPWSVDIHNEGADAVTVIGKARFTVQIDVNRTVEVKWDGKNYMMIKL